MIEQRRNTLRNALELCALLLALLAVSLRPLVCGVGARYTFVGLVEASVVNLLVCLPFLFGLLLWTARMALTGELRLARTGMEVPILLFAVLVIRSVFVSEYPWHSAMTALDWLAQMLLFFFLVHLLGDRRKAGLALACVVASAVVVALYGCHERFVGFPELLARYRLDPAGALRGAGVAPEDMADFRSRLETLRVSSTLLLPTTLAGFLVLVLPMQVGLLLDRLKERRAALAIGAGVLLQLVVLFLTKAKGGWISFAMGMLLFTALWGRSTVRRRWKPIAICVASLALVCALAQWRGLLPPASRYVDSFLVRAQYWRAGVEMIKDHPWGGIGLDEFGDAYTAYKRPQDDETQMTHNNFIQVWAETGFFGFASFCAIWAFFLARGSRSGGEEAAQPADRGDARRDMELTGVGVVAGMTAVGLATFKFLSLPVGPVAMAVLWMGWAGVFLVVFTGATTFGPMALRGIWIGVICFLIHSLVDFDLYEPGVAQTLWTLAAISAAGGARGRVIARPLRSPGRIGLAAGALAGAIAIVGLLWPPILLGGVHLGNGRMLIDEETPKWAEAITEFRKAAELSPRNAAPHEWLGALFRDMWNNQYLTFHGKPTFDLAIQHFERAAELSPRKARYHFELAELYRSGASNAKMQERAVQEYEKAVQRYPVKPLYVARLGLMYDEVKRPRPLIEDTLRRALYMDEHANRRYNKLPDDLRKKIEDTLRR